MPADDVTQSRFDGLLRAAAGGDAQARSALIAHASQRLQLLTRKMLRAYPRLRRWEETGDVFQAAMLRLHVALNEALPTSPRHFFNLAALEIRRTLIDLARRHFGPEGQAAHHFSDGQRRAADDEGGPLLAAPDKGDDSTSGERWVRFHAAIEQLSEEHREMFDLLWYDGMSHAAAGELLSVSVRTIKRRWQAARLALHDLLTSDP